MLKKTRWVAVLLALPLMASAQSVDDGKIFRDATTSIVVEVPVEVTLDGKPLRGLTAESFELLDGGDVQEISGFEVVDLGEIGAVSGHAVVSELPIIARRHFLLIFDLSFASPSAVDQSRETALQLVEEDIHPADLVAVATYSLSKGIQLILGFTPDRHQIGVALKSLGMSQLVETRPDPLGLVLGNLRGPTGDTQINSRGQAGAGGRRVPSFEGYIRDIVERYNVNNAIEARRQVTALSRSFAELADVMQKVDGRKHVVYFSEGFDSSLLFATSDVSRQQEMNRAADQGEVWRINSEERFGSTQTINVLDDMIREFRRADCTIHSVDIGGLRSDIEKASRSNGKDGLFMMANGTGGEFYENFNRLGEAMESLLEKTSVTYLLAYHPSKVRYDGKYRKLKVRLKKVPKGAKIVHRPGYYAPDPDDEPDPLEQQLTLAQQLLDGRQGGEIETAVLAVPMRGAIPVESHSAEESSIEGKSYVPVLVEIDGPSLMVGSGDTAAVKKTRGKLETEVYVYAMNVTGSVSDFFTQTLSLDLAKVGQQMLTSGLKLSLPLYLEPGDYTLRVLVRNSDTGFSALRLSTVSVPQGDEGEGRLALLPPLFPEQTDRWLIIQGQRQDQPEQQPNPFFYEDQPFVPAARARLAAGETVPVFVMGYDMGDRQSELDAEVVDAVGNPVPGPQMVLSSQAARSDDSLDRYLAALRLPPELPQGEYALRISWHDTARDRYEVSSIPFAVVAEDAKSDLLALATPNDVFDHLPKITTPVEQPVERAETVPVEALTEVYRQALRRSDGRNRQDLLSTLAALEVEALGDAPDRRLQRLFRSELKVARDLASQDLETLVPILVLHHDLYLEHKRMRRPYLVHHSVLMVRDLADLYAKQGGSIGSRIVAARALASLGGHLQENGQSASLELFERAIQLDPANESAYLGLAAFYEKRGGPYENAVTFLRRLVEALPDSREGRLRLAINQFRVGHEADALDVLAELIAEPETDWVFSLAAQELARVHADEKRYAEAIQLLESAVERRADDQKLYVQLAYLYDRHHQPYKARLLAERMSRSIPHSEAVRGVYNRWPYQTLTKERQELQRGAETRLPLLTQVLDDQLEEED